MPFLESGSMTPEGVPSKNPVTMVPYKPANTFYGNIDIYNGFSDVSISYGDRPTKLAKDH